MTEAEQHIAAFNRERAGHLWSTAVRLQREVLELREEKAELLEALKYTRLFVGQPTPVSDKIDGIIAKAEALK